MSAHELLSLLRNGSADAAAVPEPSVSPSQDQQQFPPVPPPPPPPNVPLDLLFKDLGIAPSSAGPEAPTNSSTMNEQSANLLSLLQGALNPQATPSTSDSPQHRDLSGLTKDLDDSETHSQQSQTGLNHLFHTAPNTNRSSPAAASQTIPEPASVSAPCPAPAESGSTLSRTPFDFVSGFDVLASRQNQPLNQPTVSQDIDVPKEPASGPPNPTTGTAAMRSDSPLGDVPPAAAPSTTAVDSAPSRPPPQTHQPTRRTVSQHHLSSNLTAADSPASSSAASPRLHPKDDPSQSQWKKPAEGSPQEVVPDTYLSAHLLDQIDPDSSHAGVAVSSPKYAEQEQAVRIDISEPSLDLMYRGSRDNLPITLFTSPHTFSIGRKMDVQNKVMVYATGKGRLRILDRTDGARVLLKGHNGPVSDLCLSDMPGVTEDDVLVISASVAAPTVILWRVARDVPPKASNDSHLPEGFVKVLEFSPKTPDATVRCIRRVSNDLFILATSDSRMLILDLSTDAWSRLVKGEDQVQQTEDQMKKSGLLRKVQFEYPVVDLAVAPDSSAVVVLDSAGRLHIGQVTSERGLKPRNKAPFAVHGLKPEQIALIPCDAVKAGSNEKGFFIAVSYEQGRLVHLANLQGQVLSSISISQPASQDGLQSFGHLHYNATHSTLFLSSSLRGSIYAFHIEPWPPAEPSLLGMGERDLDWLLHAATASRSNIPSARINRMVEISCPSHAVEYVDATTADQMVEVDQDMASFHVLAVEGISQTKFDASLFGNMAEAAARLRGDDAPGVMEEQPASLTNFRNAISVDVDLAVETDHESDAGSSKQQQQQQELPEVTAPPFISSLKSRSQLGASSGQAPATTATTTTTEVSMAEQLEGLEERLFNRVEKLITAREAAAEQRARHERASEQASEIGRQEKLLAMVSQTLSKQTNRTLDNSIRSEIRDSIMPAISSTVREAVDKEIGNVLRNSLQRSIPDALSGFFNRPDVTNHLVRSFSSSATPVMEKIIQNTLSDTVIPHFSQETQHMIDVLTKQMRQEIVNVRKDIETEHNVVVAELTDNIAHLKDMLQQQQQQPQQQSHFSPQQQRANHFSPPNLPQPSHPHQHQSQRGVRSSTPPSTYEDTLLEALQHQDESHLVRFLEEAPERRIQAIFHSGPKPPLSQAVILSLMHRLVKPLPQRRGPLDQQDNVRLKWFRACLQGIDFDDGETADYIPRILDVTSNALSATQPRLISAGDMTGLGATQDLVNTLQYYSRR